MLQLKRILRWLLAGILVIGILIMVFLHYANYSTGFRAGVPIKLSQKGYIIKTWEGEMNIGGLTTSAEGVIPTSWEFTVSRSGDDVREAINNAMVGGKRVKLYYHEKYARLFWRGDTKYFVYKVEEIN